MAYGKTNSFIDWLRNKGLMSDVLPTPVGFASSGVPASTSKIVPFLAKTGKRVAIGTGGLGIAGLGTWGIKSIYNRLNPDPGLYAESTDKGVGYYQITQGGNKVPVDPQSGRWQIRGNDLVQIAPDGTVMESINTSPAVSAFGGGVLRPFYESNGQFVADSTRKADSIGAIQKADSTQQVIDSLRIQNDSLQKQNQLQKEMPSIWNFKKLDSETNAMPYWKRELDQYGVFA